MKFVLDTSVLINYLRGEEIAASALIVASSRGSILVSQISLMELYGSQHRSNADIEREVRSIQALVQAYGLRFVPCSRAAQKWAFEIMKAFRSPLGRNALRDALIIGTGIAYRGWLVASDRRWAQIARENEQRQLLNIRLKVLSPVELVQRFG
jgi:predicted nucleic acid-binding protein